MKRLSRLFIITFTASILTILVCSLVIIGCGGHKPHDRSIKEDYRYGFSVGAQEFMVHSSYTTLEVNQLQYAARYWLDGEYLQYPGWPLGFVRQFSSYHPSYPPGTNWISFISRDQQTNFNGDTGYSWVKDTTRNELWLWDGGDLSLPEMGHAVMHLELPELYCPPQVITRYDWGHDTTSIAGYPIDIWDWADQYWITQMQTHIRAHQALMPK